VTVAFAQAALANGHRALACVALDVLQIEIRIQSGHSLPVAKAQQLTQEVRLIRSLIHC
jgi:hypothetical protein